MKLYKLVAWSEIIGEKRRISRRVVESRDRKQVESNMEKARLYRDLEQRIDEVVKRAVRECEVGFDFTDAEELLLFDD